jgi:cyclic pyranopterin phosphate synthase
MILDHSGLSLAEARMPLDSFNREINYLRISLTDRCNLRCEYCMPLDGVQLSPAEDVLSAAEIEIVVRAAVSVGFRKFRLTGGEPTLRRELLDIVTRIAAVDGVRDLALTTNGMHLRRLAAPLMAAGLNRVNVHVDSLHPERLAALMRWGRLQDVWDGIAAAEEAGLLPIKLNAVVTRGHNEEDVVSLARLTVERGWHVRFIELMPFGGGECAAFARERFVSTADTRRRIEEALGPLTPLPTEDPADEAQPFRLAGAPGTVGFISPVSVPYCGTCNRMRLTADGKFHLCLLNDDEMDVRHAIRSGGGLPAVARILLTAVRGKPIGHHLPHGPSTEHREMYHLGG